MRRIWHNAGVPRLLLILLLAAVPAAAGSSGVSHVNDAGNVFSPTFDAHVETEGAAALLALLRERHVRVTLFVTGTFAREHPDILRLAVRDGHEIGNHTFSHPHLTTWAASHRHDTLPGITRERLQDELLRTADAIRSATGRDPAPLWRAPYGEHNAEIRGWADELGLVHVGWTHGCGDALDALDWVEDPGSRRFMGAEAMARRLLSFENRCGVPLEGSIVLMHLGSSRPDLPLLEALPIILDEADRRGIRAVPVSEMLLRERAALGTPRSSARAAAP